MGDADGHGTSSNASEVLWHKHVLALVLGICRVKKHPRRKGRRHVAVHASKRGFNLTGNAVLWRNWAVILRIGRSLLASRPSRQLRGPRCVYRTDRPTGAHAQVAYDRGQMSTARLDKLGERDGNLHPGGWHIALMQRGCLMLRTVQCRRAPALKNRCLIIWAWFRDRGGNEV